MEVSGKRMDIDNELANLDKLCELCDVDNINIPASGFCNECEQYMCNACFGQHLRAKLCREHKLLDTNEFSITCIQNNVGAKKCKQHEAEIVKYYCSKHEAVGCGDCLVSKHSGCKTTFIKELSDNFQQNEDYKTIINKLEKLISERMEFEKKIQENKKDNKVMLEKALQGIKHFRFDINKYLDKVETDITYEVHNVMDENDTLLTKLENDCTILSTKHEEMKNMLNSELYKNDVLFIHTVECKPRLLENENAFSDLKSKSMEKYEFVCDQHLCNLVTSSQKIGTLAISTSSDVSQTTEGIIEKKVRPVVAVGARVEHNSTHSKGTVTDVRGDGTVTVNWDDGRLGFCRVGEGIYDVTLI